jgi:hypothetical protein
MILMLSAFGFAYADAPRGFDSIPGHATDRKDYDSDTGPFTRDEARVMREVWPEIRGAEHFQDIDWRALGLARAPGDREARAFMAESWDSLRRAANFDDIDWRKEYRRR